MVHVGRKEWGGGGVGEQNAQERGGEGPMVRVVSREQVNSRLRRLI